MNAKVEIAQQEETFCKNLGCFTTVHTSGSFCSGCMGTLNAYEMTAKAPSTMATKYPKYYKSVEHLTEVDVYMVHQLFDVQDPSGALQHASKKLLLPGTRTGNKSRYDDVREARDTLNRWLEMQDTLKTPH